MVTQLGLSPTSTIGDVQAVLLNAIAQEEAAVRLANSRLVHYRQQLESLAALIEPPQNGSSTSTQVSVAPTNGASADRIPEASHASGLPVGTSALSGVTATPNAPDVVQAVPTPVAPTRPAPKETKLLARFGDKRAHEAIKLVLAERPEMQLDSRSVCELVYGKNKTVQVTGLIQSVSAMLTRGARNHEWTRVPHTNPAKYQHLLPSEMQAAAQPEAATSAATVGEVQAAPQAV